MLMSNSSSSAKIMFKASSESICSSSKRVAGDNSSGAIFLFLAMTRMTRWAMVSSLMRAHHKRFGVYFDFEFSDAGHPHIGTIRPFPGLETFHHNHPSLGRAMAQFARLGVFWAIEPGLSAFHVFKL